MLRIETKQKSGLYPSTGVYNNLAASCEILNWRVQNGISYIKDGETTQDGCLHPEPEKDSKLCDIWNGLKNQVIGGISNYFFGFKDIDQLRAWFYDDELLKKILESGCVVNEYKTGPRCYEGHTQIICHRADMEYIGEYDLNLS